MTLKLAIAQLNFVVGDLAGNARKIVDAARHAYAEGARLLLTPELSIAGYAAEDLFLRPAFTERCDEAVRGIAAALADLKDMVVVVGHPTGSSLKSRSVAVQLRHNAASVLREGRILETYAKRELPNYQVFDERRYFAPGQGTCVFEVGGPEGKLNVGLLICEDAWFDEPAQLARDAGAEVLAVINASPYHVGKEGERVARMAERARKVGLPLVYAHLVGGQDEVVFEGHSFVVGVDAKIAADRLIHVTANSLVKISNSVFVNLLIKISFNVFNIGIDLFNRIINTYFSSNLKKYIEIVFDYYHQEINSCGYDYAKLENAFKKIFVSMSERLSTNCIALVV